MRVLIVTSTFPLHLSDGMPRYVYDLAAALSQTCSVTVLAPHHAGAPMQQRMGRLKIERFRYLIPARGQRLAYGAGITENVKSFWPLGLQVPPFTLALMMAVRQCLLKRRFEVVNSHWLIPQGLAVSAALGRHPGCAHVATVHGGDQYLLQKLPAARQVARYLQRHTDMFLPVGRHLARGLGELAGNPGRFAVEPMGVDWSRFARKTEPNADNMPFGGNFVLFVGRLIPIKGAACLIDAMSQIMSEHRDTGLAIIGQGPMEGALKDQARRLGIQHRIQFLGHLGHDTLPAYLHACKVLVVPSLVTGEGRTEGMPAVIAEGLAAGCRLVASGVGAIPDVIDHGINGLLTLPGDAADLAEKIGWALSGRGSALELPAEQSARALDWAEVAMRYRAHFRSVIQ